MRTHWCATSHKVGAMYKVQKKGFTLIELLVVIAIIGILASIVYASLSTAREKARDAQRAEAVKTLKAALEVYQNRYGEYPPIAVEGRGESIIVLKDSLITKDNNNYLVEIPQDPLYKNIALKDYQYVRGTTGRTYGIRVTLETPSDKYIVTPDNKWCITGVGIDSDWWIGSPPEILPECPF